MCGDVWCRCVVSYWLHLLVVTLFITLGAYMHSVCGCSWFHLKPVDGTEKKALLAQLLVKEKLKNKLLSRVPVEKQASSYHLIH